MAKTAMVQARIEPELKSEVEKIFHTLGMNTTYAISIFFRQVKLAKGIPFDVRIPNEETRRAIAEARAQAKERNSLQRRNFTPSLIDDAKCPAIIKVQERL